MRGTNALKVIYGQTDLYRFYVTIIAALAEWEYLTRQGLADGTLPDVTVHLRAGDDRPRVAVATYSELLHAHPQISSMLRTTILLTAVTMLEAFLQEVRREYRQATGEKLRGKVFEPLTWGLRIDFANAPEAVDLEFVKEIVGTRNLYVHNAGIVNPDYLEKCPSFGFKTGDRRPLTPRYLGDALRAISEFATFVDNQVAERIFARNGIQLAEYPDHVYGKRTPRGLPIPMVKVWCIDLESENNETRLTGKTFCWSRHGELRHGEILSFAVIEEKTFDTLRDDCKLLFFPPKASPASEMPNRSKLWLESHSIPVGVEDTIEDVLKRLLQANGRPPTLIDHEQEQF